MRRLISMEFDEADACEMFAYWHDCMGIGIICEPVDDENPLPPSPSLSSWFQHTSFSRPSAGRRR